MARLPRRREHENAFTVFADLTGGGRFGPGDVGREYVAKAGDCTACHTSSGGALFAGGMKFPTPLGNIYATNITPDKQQGIGAYSFDEFDRAMRQGIAKDGHRLYPAMPYTSYAKMNAEDMRALYDYLMNEVPAQNTANRASDISWPLSMRWPLAVWNQLFHDDTPYQPDHDQSAEWNRGAYLVQGRGTAAVAIRRVAGRCRKKVWTVKSRPS